MSDSLGELAAILRMLFHKMSFVGDLQDVRQRLAMLKGLRIKIYTNNVQAPVTNGGLHLITKKVMSYILGICKGSIKPAGEYVRIRISSLWLMIARMIEL